MRDRLSAVDQVVQVVAGDQPDLHEEGLLGTVAVLESRGLQVLAEPFQPGRVQVDAPQWELQQRLHDVHVQQVAGRVGHQRLQAGHEQSPRSRTVFSDEVFVQLRAEPGRLCGFLQLL